MIVNNIKNELVKLSENFSFGTSFTVLLPIAVGIGVNYIYPNNFISKPIEVLSKNCYSNDQYNSIIDALKFLPYIIAGYYFKQDIEDFTNYYNEFFPNPYIAIGTAAIIGVTAINLNIPPVLPIDFGIDIFQLTLG